MGLPLEGDLLSKETNRHRYYFKFSFLQREDELPIVTQYREYRNDSQNGRFNAEIINSRVTLISGRTGRLDGGGTILSQQLYLK